MAQTWNQDEHLHQMATLLVSPASFERCAVRGTVTVATKVMKLVCHRVSLRLWSFARRSHPPESWSLLLSDDPEAKEICGEEMACEHTWLREFEDKLPSEEAPNPHVKMLHQEFFDFESSDKIAEGCIWDCRLQQPFWDSHAFNKTFDYNIESTLADNKIIEYSWPHSEGRQKQQQWTVHMWEHSGDYSQLHCSGAKRNQSSAVDSTWNVFEGMANNKNVKEGSGK